MARGRIDLRGTVYHVMDARGVFASNPANVGATDDGGANIYKGPVPYPKMLYHPEGETRVTNPGEKVKDVDGTIEVRGRQEEIVHRIVASKREEDELRKMGWHDHPAKAIQAAIGLGRYSGEAPAMSSGQRIEDLESEIARLQEELASSQASSGVIKTTAPKP